MTPIPVAAQSIESSPASIAAACLIEFLETVGKVHQYDVREHVKLVQELASSQPVAAGADAPPELSAPRLRAIAICDGGGYQDDVTAEWTFSDAAFLKTMRAVIAAAKTGPGPVVSCASTLISAPVVAPKPPVEKSSHTMNTAESGAALWRALEAGPVEIGAEFPAGWYAGVCKAVPGRTKGDQHLMYLRGEWCCLTWKEGMAKVADKAGCIPMIHELEHLREVLPHLFYDEVYWTSEHVFGKAWALDMTTAAVTPAVLKGPDEQSCATRVMRIPVEEVVTCTEPKYGPGDEGFRPPGCDRGVKDSACCSEGCAADEELADIAKRKACAGAR